jgi:arylsulfatase A-like enzyme
MASERFFVWKLLFPYSPKSIRHENCRNPAEFHIVSDISRNNDDRIRGRTFAAPSTGVWARIGLLFVVLCVIKILLLLTYREYLYGIHWRIRPQAHDFPGEVAFYLFALLVGLNLWQLGRRGAAAGIRTMRTINFCVLGLGATFILLTFHAGDKNYLSPLMDGILGYKAIGWYLAVDLCFGPPYLAAWILAYVFGYYILGRSGREGWMLRVTAICAAAYTVFCLRDLAENRDALIALDCVGIISFVASLVPGQRPLRLFWVCSPLLGMAFFYGLLMSFNSSLLQPNPEFALLTAGSVVLFTGVTLLAWRNGGYAAWSWGLPFAFSSFVILVNSNYVLAPNYNHLLTLGLVMPRYFLCELILVAILGALAFSYHRLLPKDPLWWLDVINVGLITLALADLQLSRIMGVRLDWELLNYGNSPIMMWRLARPYLPAFFGVLTVLLVVYALALMVIQKWWGRIVERDTAPIGNSGLCALIAFFLLGLAGWGLTSRDKAEGQTAGRLVSTSPFWRKTVEQPLSREQLLAAAQQLEVPLLVTPAVAPEAETAPRDLNVVLVFQESSYNKYLSLFDGTDNTEPLLSRYKDRMELFPNFFSNFAGSIRARFATFTGLYPVRDLKGFTQQRVPVKSIFEILHGHGYDCSLFDSCYFDYDDERDFLKGRELDAMYDADTMPVSRQLPPASWGIREEETLRAMQDRIKQYAADRKKFFLTYAPVAPHNPFDALSNRFRQRHMGRLGDFTPAYLNSINYMDWIISTLIDQLKACDLLDKTLIVITDDHGEMLGENGGPVGHGWAVTPSLVNIPLIIMDPARRGYMINDTVGSQVDLLPTILDRLNIPLPGGQIYQGTSLYSSALDNNRLIYLNSFQQYAIVRDRQLFCGDRAIEDTKISDAFYLIANRGARTSFIQTNAPDVSIPPISRFDVFQENFLANYAHYCRVLH